MFKILSLHLVFFIRFLANLEEVFPKSSHSIVPCWNNSSATFQSVSGDDFLVGAGQTFGPSGLLITGLSLSLVSGLVLKCLHLSFPPHAPKPMPGKATWESPRHGLTLLLTIRKEDEWEAPHSLRSPLERSGALGLLELVVTAVRTRGKCEPIPTGDPRGLPSKAAP